MGDLRESKSPTDWRCGGQWRSSTRARVVGVTGELVLCRLRRSWKGAGVRGGGGAGGEAGARELATLRQLQVPIHQTTVSSVGCRATLRTSVLMRRRRSIRGGPGLLGVAGTSGGGRCFLGGSI